MKSIRKAVVAGSFYTSNRNQLQLQIDTFLQKADTITVPSENILGVISPHAGYVYSGQCAAYSFKAIQQKNFDLAVIIAPSHQFGDFYFSVGDYDAYDTPLGLVEVDKDKTKKLLSDSKFVFFPYAHSKEHSLEVQLPFLLTVKPKAKLLPILIGQQYDKSSEYLSDVLFSILKDKIEKTVFIASSDLSHYHNDETARKMDSKIAKSIEELNVDKTFNLIAKREAEACGFGGILTLMNLAKKLGFDKIKTLNCTNSGGSFGDKSHVVGYLSTLFYK